ncbi:hypothetical protein EV368DRAFT_82901 [Lentinula lateritia]|nr:hypothetical protein EV368DRAFT_82901 [Lentinula lateritia]
MSVSHGRQPKVRRIEQPSRKTRELEELLLHKNCLLKEAEDELDELVNCDTEQVQFLEDESKLLFQQKTAAEIRAERLQHRVNELDIRTLTLLITLTTNCNSADNKDDPVSKPQRIKSILASTASSCDCGALLDGLKITSDNKGCSREQQDSAVLLRKDASTTTQSLVPNAEDSYTAEADSNSIPFKIELMMYPEDASQSKNAEKWFPAVFEYLNQHLGEEYGDLFNKWVEFECSRGWASSNKGLACQSRPEELNKWIINCRYNRHGNEPDLKTDDSLVQFREHFMCWWKQLRTPSPGAPSRELETEWASLDRSGKNG